MRGTVSRPGNVVIHQFDTMAALFDEDAARPMSPYDLDDALWLLLIAKIKKPAELAQYEPPVSVCLASRWLESEVGNGGFAQAAFNIPHWFELAEAGYTALGKHRAAPGSTLRRRAADGSGACRVDRELLTPQG